MGIFHWNIFESFDQGKTWHAPRKGESFYGWDWPANFARERSDMFTCNYHKNNFQISTGSYGFKAATNLPTNKKQIIKSTSLFYRITPNNWKTVYQKFYEIPGIDIIVTFPRFFQKGLLILVPAYTLLSKYDESRCLVWRSENGGETFRLWNMFPDGIDGNEMAFIDTDYGILAHIRSDKHPWLMESWSQDNGITWSYPTDVYSEANNGSNIIGGPPHLLRLKDNRILCSYGYRFDPMGIRAIISNDEGETWSVPYILRKDGGYLSSLHKKNWWQKWTCFNFGKKIDPGNDIGYPVSIQLSDKSILTAYYITCKDQITGIEMTKWGI